MSKCENMFYVGSFLSFIFVLLYKPRAKKTIFFNWNVILSEFCYICEVTKGANIDESVSLLSRIGNLTVSKRRGRAITFITWIVICLNIYIKEMPYCDFTR